VTAGYGALDERELKRLLFMPGGFIDIREAVFSDADPELCRDAVLNSLIFKGLDLASTKGYITAVGFPEEYKNDERVPEFLDEIFKRLQKITKTTFVLRSSHFNRKLKEIRVNLLAAGLVRSRGIKKIIKQTARDIRKYKGKSDIESLDLSDISW
jgi:hypothetical protein